MNTMMVWILIISTHVNSGAVVTIPNMQWATAAECARVQQLVIANGNEQSKGNTSAQCVQTTIIK